MLFQRSFADAGSNLRHFAVRQSGETLLHSGPTLGRKHAEAKKKGPARIGRGMRLGDSQLESRAHNLSSMHSMPPSPTRPVAC